MGKEEVEKIHSYDCPCVIKIPIEANEKYEREKERNKFLKIPHTPLPPNP